MAVDAREIWGLADVLSIPRGGAPRTMAGIVDSVDDQGTAWVSVPGSDAPVPAAVIADAEPGDAVTVTVADGRAAIEGNATSPAATVRSVERVEAFAEQVDGRVDGVAAQTAQATALAEEAQAAAEATEQHFWHRATDPDSDGAGTGAFVTDEEQATFLEAIAAGTEPTEERPLHNLLMNAEGILLRAAKRVRAAFTPSGVAFYDGQGNAAANVVASFGASGATFSTAGHVKVSVTQNDGLTVYDNRGSIVGRFYASDASGSEGNIGALIIGGYGNNQNTWSDAASQFSPRLLVGSDLKAVGPYPQAVFGVGNKARADALFIVGAGAGTVGEISDSNRYNALVVLQNGTVLLDTSRITNVENETHVINMNYNIDSPNKVLATGTSSGTTTAGFRSLVADDVPSLPASKIGSGTLAVARGGTGASTATQNYVFAAPYGQDGAPTFRALHSSDIPALSPTKSGFQAGTVSISSVNSASGADSAITFTPSFSSAPIVIVGMTSDQTVLTGACSAYAMNVSATGFTLRRQNNSTSARNLGAYWMAFEI